MQTTVSGADRLRSFANFIATHPGAAELVIAIDDSALKPCALRPEDVPLGSSDLALFRALREMGIIDVADGGFRLTILATHMIGPLRTLLAREPETLTLAAYVDRVIELLSQRDQLPPDPHCEGRATNRVDILRAIAVLEPLLVADDAALWLARPRTEFGGETPLALLARGESERVIARINSAGLALYF